MPSKPTATSIIPIGFGLSGYEFMAKKDEQNAASKSFDVGIGVGMDAIWGGGLVEDRWVADEKLKQVQVQVTMFQAAPMIYNCDGEKLYGEMTDYVDDHSDIGGAAFGGGEGSAGARLTREDINGCQGGQMSPRLKQWQSNISQSESGRKEFYMGAGMCPYTLCHYLEHFYGISVDFLTAQRLCEKKCVNVEAVFNTTGSNAKAYHIRVVDSSGKRGFKGGQNNVKGQVIDYDILDLTMGMMMTKTFSDIITFTHKNFGNVNGGGKLEFPWYDKGYDYKRACVPGYSPEGIAQLGLNFKNMDAVFNPVGHCVWHTQGRTQHGAQPIARVRYFVDPNMQDKARSVIPNLPDEFFTTNYANLGAAEWASGSIDLSQFSDTSQLMIGVADKLAASIRGSHAFHYGGPYLRPSGQPFPTFTSGNGCVDCDGYVNWVLLEAGIVNNTGLCNISAAQWTASHINKSIINGYQAVDIGRDITKAIPGDIMVFGLDGAHHCGIYVRGAGSSLVEYGMGNEGRVTGSKSMPGGTWGTNKLARIIRIVKPKEGEA